MPVLVVALVVGEPPAVVSPGRGLGAVPTPTSVEWVLRTGSARSDRWLDAGELPQAGEPVVAAPDPFAGLSADGLLAAHPTATRTRAAVMDASGRIWSFGTTDERLPTASAVKVQVMAAVFLRLQDLGRTAPDVYVSSRLRAMITVSDNVAATELISWLGGRDRLESAGRRLGMVETDNTSARGWGVSLSTPEDQLRLLSTVLRYGNGVLADRWVTRARELLSSVVTAQRWGVGAGRPVGSTLFIKNGWWTTAAGDYQYPGSRITSMALVERADGTGYAIAVFGNGYCSQAAGIAATEFLSRHVAARLG